MPLSLWLLITAITITAGAHVSVRGRSLRDRLRRTEPGQLIGLRLTPGLRNQLSAADIVSLADDSPVTLDALCFYHIAPEVRGEHAHRYFRAAERSDTSPEPWTHLVATLPVEASADKALRFLIHRLGTLGIRARRLTAQECALTESSAEVVQLRRTGRSHHVAALGRKPHLWLSRQRDIAITNGPAQVIGAGSSGQTITMCPAKLPRLEVDCGNQDICELLIGMLSLGYRVGIRTARPHFYTVALDLGAVLLARAGDDTVDVVVVEEYEPDLCTGIARIIEVSRTGSPTAAAEMPASCPRLAMGEFTWTLSTARTTDELQPLAMRATSGSVPESTHPNLADRPAPGSRQAHPAAPGHSERHFLGHPADRLLQEAHPPSASVHR
ncbi:hypothetical protein [Corynebacterium sp. HMSC065H09]|uniref:hypothetical protein n=1 Tax=Corynebacterium sp. HMSC065H09 TaxID=1739382 RepID=UPI0009F6A19D|nr:hypothetical protein [Corynebacterium sp. HMSC065H09]